MGVAKSSCAVLDIGSTYTKGILVDTSGSNVIARTQVPSTASDDVRIGVERCLDNLASTGGGEPAEVFASSSAQGGLTVVAIGLVPSLTLEAAQEVALGAGAKILRAFGYRLTSADLNEIGILRPDIILLCGGIDGGDEDTLVGNSKALAEQIGPYGTVVVAGNRTVSDDAARILTESGWDARIVANVLPEIDVLNTEPAREAIRTVFLDKITEAKGIGLARDRLDGPLMPTPAAVLTSVELLTGRRDVAGPLSSVMLVDVGGATTDVVSVMEDSSRDSQTVQVGLRPPIVKRTVEGDLGMRWNARTIFDRYDLGRTLTGSLISEQQSEELLQLYHDRPEILANDLATEEFDALLVRTAIREGSLRHCGTIEELRVPHSSSAFRVRGKDLRDVELVVGTGGILTHQPGGADVLKCARAEPSVPESLRPVSPEFVIDSDYTLFACGVLADRYPEVALEMATKSLGIK